MSLNQSAYELCEHVARRATSLRVRVIEQPQGGRIFDFGCGAFGGLEAGVALAQICLANRAKVAILPSDPRLGPWPTCQVTSDEPLAACMGAQYAGWKISVGKFFAMGSGPMRALRGKEAVLDQYGLIEKHSVAVGVLECEDIPGPDVVQSIADACELPTESIVLCVAPTRSIAGVIQVVSRSVETCLHKLFELKFDLREIISAHGVAPIPPPAIDFVQGIGRTNDAVLYGGHVTLWVDSEDERLRTIGPSLPSSASRDFGRPFADTFKDYGFDFYRVDPNLFAPATVTLINLRSGNSFRFGAVHSQLLHASFGEASV